MAFKLRCVLPAVFFAAVFIFSACSDTDSDLEIWSMTGYYLRTDRCDMIIKETDIGNGKVLYEPIIIYFEGEEQGDVSMDSLETGDKIEVDVKLVMTTYPGRAPIYGLRFIGSGDVSNISNETLLNLENMGYHAVIGKKTEQPFITHHSGYFVRTETDCFFMPAEKYGMLSDVDLLKIHPAAEMEAPPDFDVSGASLDGFNTGDRIWVDIMLVQELYPPVSPVCGAALIETGDISAIDPNVISKLEELGYKVI